MSYSSIAKGVADLLAGIVIMGLLIACTTTPALALATQASATAYHSPTSAVTTKETHYPMRPGGKALYLPGVMRGSSDQPAGQVRLVISSQVFRLL